MKALRKIILVNIMLSLAILLMFSSYVPMAAADEKDYNYDCITVDAAINSYDLEALAADLGIDKYELMLLIDEGELFFDIKLCEVIMDSPTNTEQATKHGGGRLIMIGAKPPLEPLPPNPCAGKCKGCDADEWCAPFGTIKDPCICYPRTPSNIAK